MKTKNLLVSVSGGRSSALMAIHVATSSKYENYNIVFVFANTGLEHDKTIKFLRNLEAYIGRKIHLVEGVYSMKIGEGVRHKEVDFDNLDMNGTPMTGAIAKRNAGKSKGVPNNGMPYCSEYTKKRVIHSFAKNYFGTTKYITAIGFRLEDMPKRVAPIQVRELFDNKIYPLLSDFSPMVDVPYLDEFWSKMPFSLEINSRYGNCQLCFKKSDKNLCETIANNTSLIEWYDKMEKKYNGSFFRGKRTVIDMLELSKLRNYEYLDDIGENCLCS